MYNICCMLCMYYLCLLNSVQCQTVQREALHKGYIRTYMYQHSVLCIYLLTLLSKKFAQLYKVFAIVHKESTSGHLYITSQHNFNSCTS